jgi:probable HAF family extracellular repeat protein
MFMRVGTKLELRFVGRAALLCGLATIAAAQTITLQSITPIPIVANALNDSGEVAGASRSYPFHPVIYFQGVVNDLGTFGGFCCSSADAINDAGQVVGHAINASNNNRAFLYTGGVKRDLGTLAGAGGSSFALGINASGDVVGWSEIIPGQYYHAFLYSGGVMRDLGTLGGQSSQAQAIDGAADVIGTSQVADGSWHSFVYSNGVMQDFGLDHASAINAKGQIVGVTAAGVLFVYENGVMTKLSMSGHTPNPYGINALGQIVGIMDAVTNSPRAFLYTPVNGIIDLNALLPPNSGWVLTNASAISDAGQIVGGGTYLGQYSAFLMTLAGNSPPVTTAAIFGPAGTNGWYLGAVSVTLNATGRGSPVASTYFSVDGAPYQLYAGPFPVAGDGTHRVSYYSVATTGSQEPAGQQTIRIDAAKPVSHVAALPATGSAPSFSVSWSGADVLSGIANYTMFVADNGGAFVPWISGTTATQGTYIGALGHTYGFYSIATDVAGNQEPAKTSPEAVTAVPTRSISRIAFQSITAIPISASAINASGDIAGTLQLSVNPSVYHAAIYSHGIISDLGTLGGLTSAALAINDAGQVAGQSDKPAPALSHAFLYSGGVMHDLGDLGYPYSVAHGINNSGEVVGLSATSATAAAAFLYSGGVMNNLGTLGSYLAQANAINDAGEVVGYAYVPSNVSSSLAHAFLYSKGAMHDLGTLPGGFDYAWAVGINASGQITGWTSGGLKDIDGIGRTRAFLYENGVMTDIGALRAGSYYTSANGINASGQIVGFGEIGGAGRAFLYMPATGIVDLNSLLPLNSGWVLEDALALNDAGQIVGNGTYLGQQNSSFLLKISTITADVNGDGRVDCTDVSVVKAGIGKKTGQPGFDPSADVNHDGVIDIRDLAIVTQALPTGTACH